MTTPLRHPASGRRRFAAGALLGWLLAATALWAAPPATNAPLPFAKGTLVGVDLPRRTLTLTTARGDQTFGWTERTYMFFGKERLSADKLKPGDLVAVRHYPGPDGNLLVLRLKVYRNGQGRLPEPQPLPATPAP